MSAARTAYLVLERLLIEAEASSDAFADVLGDSMMPFWEALTAAERAALQARTGTDAEQMNQTVIRDASGPITENRALVAYLVLERVLMDCEQHADPLADDLRDALMPFWEAVAPADRVALQARTGTAIDDLNPTRLVELAAQVVVVVPWIVGDSITMPFETERAAAPAVPGKLDELPTVAIDRPYRTAA